MQPTTNTNTINARASGFIAWAPSPCHPCQNFCQLSRTALQIGSSTWSKLVVGDEFAASDAGIEAAANALPTPLPATSSLAYDLIGDAAERAASAMLAGVNPTAEAISPGSMATMSL